MLWFLVTAILYFTIRASSTREARSGGLFPKRRRPWRLPIFVFAIKLGSSRRVPSGHCGSGNFPALLLNVVPDIKVSLFLFRLNRTASPAFRNVRAARSFPLQATQRRFLHQSSLACACHTRLSQVAHRITQRNRRRLLPVVTG